MKGCKCNTCHEIYFPHYVKNGLCKKCEKELKKDANKLAQSIADNFNLKLE